MQRLMETTPAGDFDMIAREEEIAKEFHERNKLISEGYTPENTEHNARGISDHTKNPLYKRKTIGSMNPDDDSDDET